MIKTIAILALLLTIQVLSVPLISDEIIADIFQHNKYYVIYVCEQPNPDVQWHLIEFCQGDRLCAIMDSSYQKYSTFKAYIGETKTQYFTIIDAARHLKYILPIIDGFTVNDLLIFQSKFEQGLLQPFYASETPDPSPYDRCRKVVGKDLESFLELETPVKVLFLYTNNEACRGCGQILRTFADIAEKMYDKEIVIFGYYDIFRNDSPLIVDEIHPYFLIYVPKKSQPYGFSGEKINELYDKIIDVVMENTQIDVTNYRKESMNAAKNNNSQRDSQPANEEL